MLEPLINKSSKRKSRTSDTEMHALQSVRVANSLFSLKEALFQLFVDLPMTSIAPTFVPLLHVVVAGFVVRNTGTLSWDYTITPCVRDM